MTLSATNLDKPMSIGSDSAELRTEGSTFTFEDLGVASGGSWLVFKTGRISLSDSDGDGLPDWLLLSEAEGRFDVIMGDLILQCVFAVTGEGGLDTTPPTVFLGTPPLGPFRSLSFLRPCAPCSLLADESFAVQTSELVQLGGGIEKLVEVVDSNGAEVRFPPDVTETAVGFAFSAMGIWPLGQTISVTVNPGLVDRAGNPTSESFTQTYRVVDDPGLLDNYGFEAADFSGFIASGGPLEVAESFLGIGPPEGRQMAVFGSLDSCGIGGGATLTSRLVVPEGASHLGLDYDLVITSRESSLDRSARAIPLIGGTLRSTDGFRDFSIPRPPIEETTELSGDFRESGFRRLLIPVADLAGQELVMTLRLRPGILMAPPPLCVPGVLLLDNLRFE